MLLVVERTTPQQVRLAPWSETGATMVEFALSSVFLLFIFGAFFDIGLALHKWMLLRHLTLEATREIAVNYVTRPHCDNIKTFLEDTATERLHKEFGADVGEGNTRWCIEWVPPDSGGSAVGFAALKISSEIPGNCFFICKFFPNGWRLKTSSETIIELEQDGDEGCSTAMEDSPRQCFQS